MELTFQKQFMYFLGCYCLQKLKILTISAFVRLVLGMGDDVAELLGDPKVPIFGDIFLLLGDPNVPIFDDTFVMLVLKYPNS